MDAILPHFGISLLFVTILWIMGWGCYKLKNMGFFFIFYLEKSFQTIIGLYFAFKLVFAGGPVWLNSTQNSYSHVRLTWL